MTQRLLDTYWRSWCADTQQLLQQLPSALQQPTDTAVAATCERWLLELKVPTHAAGAGKLSCWLALAWSSLHCRLQTKCTQCTQMS